MRIVIKIPRLEARQIALGLSWAYMTAAVVFIGASCLFWPGLPTAVETTGVWLFLIGSFVYVLGSIHDAELVGRLLRKHMSKQKVQGVTTKDDEFGKLLFMLGNVVLLVIGSIFFVWGSFWFFPSAGPKRERGGVVLFVIGSALFMISALANIRHVQRRFGLTAPQSSEYSMNSSEMARVDPSNSCGDVVDDEYESYNQVEGPRSSSEQNEINVDDSVGPGNVSADFSSQSENIDLSARSILRRASTMKVFSKTYLHRFEWLIIALACNGLGSFLFTAGSVLFLPSLSTFGPGGLIVGTLTFVFGSACFLAGSIAMHRELHMRPAEEFVIA